MKTICFSNLKVYKYIKNMYKFIYIKKNMFKLIYISNNKYVSLFDY